MAISPKLWYPCCLKCDVPDFVDDFAIIKPNWNFNSNGRMHFPKIHDGQMMVQGVEHSWGMGAVESWRCIHDPGAGDWTRTIETTYLWNWLESQDPGFWGICRHGTFVDTDTDARVGAATIIFWADISVTAPWSWGPDAFPDHYWLELGGLAPNVITGIIPISGDVIKLTLNYTAATSTTELVVELNAAEIIRLDLSPVWVFQIRPGVGRRGASYGYRWMQETALVPNIDASANTFAFDDLTFSNV